MVPPCSCFLLCPTRLPCCAAGHGYSSRCSASCQSARHNRWALRCSRTAGHSRCSTGHSHHSSRCKHLATRCCLATTVLCYATKHGLLCHPIKRGCSFIPPNVAALPCRWTCHLCVCGVHLISATTSTHYWDLSLNKAHVQVRKLGDGRLRRFHL